MKKHKTCGTELVSSREDHLYESSGLPNVVLADVEVRRCPTCGTEEVVLPRIAELHRAIALDLLHKPTRFVGPEVRYLRKYMGWSGVDFAAHAGVTAETVSRWENDREPLSSVADRLLRLIVSRGWPVEDYPVDDLTKIDDRKDPPPAEVRLGMRNHQWMSAGT